MVMPFARSSSSEVAPANELNVEPDLLEPRWVVMENVAGFPSMDQGRFVAELTDELRLVGFIAPRRFESSLRHQHPMP